MSFEATARAAAAATKGNVLGNGDITVCGIATDSREVQNQTLFVARTGESLNGHDYIGAAIAAGAAACLVERSWADAQPSGWNKVPAVVVEDSTAALGQLARWWRRECRLPTAVVTGSNGKTSTKELTKCLLEQLVGAGTASSKSFNNNVGLPQTILQSGPTDKWLLLEAGMNHPGELDYLGAIATPDAAVVLNIGPAHIGFLGTLAKIADAKCELLRHVAPGGAAIINADDDELLSGVRRLEAGISIPLNRYTFGIEREAQVRGSKIESLGMHGSSFTLCHKGREVRTSIPLLGAHNVLNALAGVSVALNLFPSVTLEAVGAALPSVKGAPMRLQLTEVGGITLINDAYNANPRSMSGAVQTVRAVAQGRPFAVVVADMLELGELSEQFHAILGREIGAAGASLVVALGSFASTVCQEAKASGAQMVVEAADPAAAAQVLLTNRARFSVCLVKGSRGMALERVVNAFVEGVGEQSSVS